VCGGEETVTGKRVKVDESRRVNGGVFIREKIKRQETVCRSKPGKGLLDCRRTLAAPDGETLRHPKGEKNNR
jgi:hypothetical protein